MELKIEKNIPVPQGNSVWPYREMKKGDSFVIPASLRPAATTAAHYAKVKVMTRRTGDGNVRVWRVA